MIFYAKLLNIMSKKVDGFLRDHDRTKYLVLFGPEKYDSIFYRIRYISGLKSGIKYIGCHN